MVVSITTANKGSIWGDLLSYFQTFAIFLVPFLYICTENISLLKQNFLKYIPSFLKKHKMTFIVNVKLLFDQSHFNFSANNQIPETYNGHYNISHNISDSLSFLLKSKEKLYLL